jgi:hypothetical protein
MVSVKDVDVSDEVSVILYTRESGSDLFEQGVQMGDLGVVLG